MARKMIDDVKNKRISENDARENVQEAYHEALMHEQQDETKPVGKTYWTNERLNGANSVEFFKSDGDRITFSDSVSFVVLDLDTSDAAFPTYKVKVDAPFGPYYVSIREDEFRKDLTNTDGQRIFASQPPPKPPANVSGSGNVAMATSDYRAVFSFFLILFFIGVYMMPTMVARRNNHLNTAAICALNILLGWTFLGWVVALVWALTKSGAQAQRG
jgi:hypothetical protein